MNLEDQSAFPLTAVRLRFDCRAVTDVDLGGLRAGMRLRGALLNVMNRSICALSPFPPPERLRIDPQHVETCPVCWLQLYEPRRGQARRAFALQPPLNVPARLPAGKDFSFRVTLLGEGQDYLPYFVLAVREVGEVGVGPRRGRFQALGVWSEGVDGESQPVWGARDAVLRAVSQKIAHSHVRDWSVRQKQAQTNGNGEVTLWFSTPLRIIHEKRLLKTPRFEAIFDALLKRLDELADLYAGGYQRPYAERLWLRQAARQVELAENCTEWVELSSHSNRTDRDTWISGLIGRAVYRAPQAVWDDLLEWLDWAEIVQVGKDTVKGNGVVRIIERGG